MSLELFYNTLICVRQSSTAFKLVKWLLVATKPYSVTPGSNKSCTAWDKSGNWTSLAHQVCPKGHKKHTITSQFEMGTYTASDNVL